jgi:UDP-N-acetylmuramate dehydrogenase
MRIGGAARFFAEVQSLLDVEAVWEFAQDQDLPLIVLGNGSNTVFSDEEINAVVIRLKAEKAEIEGNTVRVQAGKNLAMLINELAAKDLDLSSLTGIPGTIGGAIFGNAGEGPSGRWIDHYVREVTVFFEGEWQTFTREECDFGYRESVFKHGPSESTVIWEAVLHVPSHPAAAVKAQVESLLKKRIETQPHIKTAGSCFKAVGATPAWKLIDAAGLRGLKIGDVEIAQKHANFLLNTGKASYKDAKAIVEKVRATVPQELDVEMRFFEQDGSLAF